jgi:zinc transport system substrate-binding protein
MRRIIQKFTVTAVLLAFLPVLCSCGVERAEDDKLSVVTTLFPQYDFAQTIGGNRANVTMLLPFGSESHTYDPSIKDITTVSGADMFVYTGESLERWASELVENTIDSGCVVLDLSKNITLLDGVGEKNHDHAVGEHDHTHDFDGHIWTNPENAIVMAENIRDAYISLDPEGKDYYTENAVRLTEQLHNLSEKLEKLSENYDGRTVYFGGRFAFLYMFDACGFNYKSPYHGCGEESEPSIRVIAEISEAMKKDGAKYIFKEEMSEGKIASALASETGATVLIMHSCHNLSLDEARAGENYISLMNKNIENLERVLSE